MSTNHPVPKEEVDRLGDQFGQQPVLSGPFKLKEWIKGQQLTFVKNTDYYEPGKPYLDQVQVQIAPPDVALLRVEKGEADYPYNNIPETELPRILSDPTLKTRVGRYVANNYHYLFMSIQMDPFRDKRVRQAVAQAIDKDALTNRISTRCSRKRKPQQTRLSESSSTSNSSTRRSRTRRGCRCSTSGPIRCSVTSCRCRRRRYRRTSICAQARCGKLHNGQQAAEVVVVGAGCIGASVAVHLAMAGQREVVLVEKNEPAAMTTGRSSAIVRQHYSEPTFTHWALESLSIWHRFDEIFGVEPVFTRTGWVIAVDRRTWSRCATALSSSARSASTHVRFHVMSWSRWNHLRNLTISRVRPMSRKQATAIRRGHHGDWPIRRYWLATSEPFRGGIQS